MKSQVFHRIFQSRDFLAVHKEILKYMIITIIIGVWSLNYQITTLVIT